MLGVFKTIGQANRDTKFNNSQPSNYSSLFKNMRKQKFPLHVAKVSRSHNPLELPPHTSLWPLTSSPVFGVLTAGREGATDGDVYQLLLGHWDSCLPVSSSLWLLSGALFAETDCICAQPKCRSFKRRLVWLGQRAVVCLWIEPGLGIQKNKNVCCHLVVKASHSLLLNWNMLIKKGENCNKLDPWISS